jgi:acyl carrier protein
MGYHVITKEQGIYSLRAVLHRDPAHVVVGLDGGVQHVRRSMDGQSQAVQQLAAYYMLRPGARPVRWPELRDRFGVQVPCEFLQVPQMPLTEEGQIDRAALLGLKSKQAESIAAPSVPQTEAERKIAAIWQELLRVDKVSTQDNFFDLGGDSLLLVQFHNRLQAAFGRDLPVVEMFKYPTISALADYLSQTPDKPSLQESEARASARRAAIRQRRSPRV